MNELTRLDVEATARMAVRSLFPHTRTEPVIASVVLKPDGRITAISSCTIESTRVEVIVTVIQPYNPNHG